MNLKLEAIVVPVSDVDRAKKFYQEGAPKRKSICAPKTRRGAKRPPGESNISFMWRRHSRRKAQWSAPSFHAGRCHWHPRARPQSPAIAAA
jgi:hypothetical protein